MSLASKSDRPLPVTLVSIYFLLAALYLWILSAILIVAPGSISLMLGSRFMHGLELAGPYMMLLVGCGYAVIGWGLFRLYNWARWLAMLVFVISVGSLVPVISAAQFNLRFFACGIEIAVRAAAGFYLAQAPTVLESFAKPARREAPPQIHAQPSDANRLHP